MSPHDGQDREAGLHAEEISPNGHFASRFGEALADGDACFRLDRDGAELAYVRLNAAEATLTAVPARTDLEASVDGVAYAAAVLQFAAGQVRRVGHLLDVRDPLPDRLIDPLLDLAGPVTTRDNPTSRRAFALGALAGYVERLGTRESYKPVCCQAAVNDVLLTFGEAESPFHQRAIRVAPLRTVLIVGLDETTTELAGHLRALGFRVAVAEQMAVKRRDRIAQLAEQGFAVLDAADLGGLVARLTEDAPVALVVEGYCSDSVLDPEERLEPEAKPFEAANRAAVEAVRARFGCPVLVKGAAEDAQLFDTAALTLLRGALPNGSAGSTYRFASLDEAALLAAALPVLAGERAGGPTIQPGSVELAADVTLPTAVPYGARNRHSPDDVAIRIARGAERRFLALLDRLDPALKGKLRATGDPDLAVQRPWALAIHHRLGPWTVHSILELEVRATTASGAALRADDYRALLPRLSGVSLVAFDDLGLDAEQVLALDGSQLQNLVFQKLGKIHSYRIAGTVVPISDAAFKVILLTPRPSAGYLNRLVASLAATGLAGRDAGLMRRLAEEVLDLPRIDARVADTFPPRLAPNGAVSLRAPRATIATEGPAAGLTRAAVPGAGPLLDVIVEDGGHTLRTRAAAGVDRADPAQRVAYLFALLDHIRAVTTRTGCIVQCFDEQPRQVKRFLAAGQYVQDPAVAGLAQAPFALGNLVGTRLRLGSDRVPESDRLVQVDLYRRDDGSEEPLAATITFGTDDDAPLIAMPTTVQLVCGFGNIAGDIGVLERRLGYRVVGWNRSPNERARHALENGIALYEFDEVPGPDGKLAPRDKQRRAYARAGLAMVGTVRDLLDNGLVVGGTDVGRPVRARVGHILDGLFGSSRHPATGKPTKNSEIYRDLLFAEYEARGIPTIYNGYNTPETVAAGRIFVHDAFRTSRVDPGPHYGETGGRRSSVMCVSCNTTNITSVLLRLIAIPGLTDLTARVLTNRKTCDPFVGEGKQTVNYQGMAYEFNYHHWEDSKLFFDAVQDPAIREQLGRTFAREVKTAGGAPEWAISTHATGQAGTEFHVGMIHLHGQLNGGRLDATAIKEAIASSGIENVQVIDFPGDRVNSTQLLATLHQRIGIRNLYVQPCVVVQDAADVVVMFFTPHLYNVKPNNLVAGLNRDGLVANTVAGLDAATTIVGGTLQLDRQRAALRRYYPPRLPERETHLPVYFFQSGAADGMVIADPEARRRLLGGKGAGLAEMATISYQDPLSGQPAALPLPPGYTITTAQTQRYFDGGRRLPADLEAAIDVAQLRLEAAMGKRLGDPANPLLVSVRSGAAVSMPGMMDTILNLGLNDRVVEGLAAVTGDPDFAWDCYQRFVEMFSDVVLGVSREQHLRPLGEQIMAGRTRSAAGRLAADDSKRLVDEYRAVVERVAGRSFPDDPGEQLRAAIVAVMESSFSDRAVTYRHINNIPDDVISAVNVVAMVFGNGGDGSATGVAFTRDPMTGERALNGEYLVDAQGEDVVAGIRTGRRLPELAFEPHPGLRAAARRLGAIAEALERHFRDAQDLEFTIERGELWLLQTRRLGGRSGRAALRIVTDMVDEGLISPREAIVLFGDPKGLNELLASIFDPGAEAVARVEGRLLTTGLAASVGAASGHLVVSSERAEELSRAGKAVILVRPETSPEDVGGLHAAQGVLTARGGIVSHAAIVARGLGKAAVVGAAGVAVDEAGRRMLIGDRVVEEGEVISLNGTNGTVYLGALPVVPSPIKQRAGGKEIDPEGADIYERFMRLLDWAKEAKAMQIRANAETPKDLAVALALGAEGIGLARTEHAVLEPAARRIAFSALIIAATPDENARALAVLEPPMEEEMYEIFKLLQGKPATIRLYDPVPNEFLPRSHEEVGRIAEFMGLSADEVRARAGARAETNPMLGHRGVRLYVIEPSIAEMQVRATLRGAARALGEGVPVSPEIQIPLVINRTEILRVAATIRRAAGATLAELGVEIPYKIGVMVETPAAVRTADEYARDIDYFSLGVNDLSQTVLAVSRDDTARFIHTYEDLGILNGDPFRSIDRIVGLFIEESVKRAKAANPDIFIFTAGDVGGDPPSVNLFHDLGIDGVSAGPWLVPLGILSAAQANVRRPR